LRLSPAERRRNLNPPSLLAAPQQEHIMSIDHKLSRRVTCAFLAVLLTAGVHGGWLRGMDRDAIATIQKA